MGNWFNTWRLKRLKKRVLFEVECDLDYIRTYKHRDLVSDEGALRRRMAELNKKKEQGTELTEDEQMELSRTIDSISKSKAVKNEYEKYVDLRTGLMEYIMMLETPKELRGEENK